MAALAVMVGLATSAPPGLGMAGNHDGLLVHPIFPHRHGDGHSYAVNDGASNLANHEPASVDAAPGLSVPLTANVAKDASAGTVVPFALTAAVVWISRRAAPYDARLVGRAVTPPTPPPRVSPVLV